MVRVFLERQPTEHEQEIIDEIETELIADIGDDVALNIDILPMPQWLPVDQGAFVYSRYENVDDRDEDGVSRQKPPPSS